MDPGELTQFVAFTSALSEDVFVQRWRPVAGAFLRQGLTSITLAAVTDVSDSSGQGVSFVSRNTWPLAAYRTAFPSGLAAEAAYGGVAVTQPGVFRSLSTQAEESERQAQGLVLAFVTLRGAPIDRETDAIAVRDALGPRLPAGTEATVYARDAPGSTQRVDLVVRVSAVTDAADRMPDMVREAVRESVTPAGLTVLSGREILTLADGGPEGGRHR